jgi:hypothetical protein
MIVPVHLFGLTEPTSKSFKGIVVIFSTSPQRVWRKWVTDDDPQVSEHRVAANEVHDLTGELAALKKGGIPPQSVLLTQLFKQPDIARNHLVAFIGGRSITQINIASADFKGYVDRWYDEARAERGIAM